MQINLSIPLPRNFRRADFLKFHQRDAQMLSERWDVSSPDLILDKGIVWDAMPACLQFHFYPNDIVQINFHIDSGRKKIDAEKTKARLAQLVEHMLGLNQTTTEFEAFAATQADISQLVANQTGLRVPQAASPFEALSWAITGQQISLSAAISLRRKLIQRAGLQHSSGIICYPQPEQLLALTEADLCACSFSETKAATLLNLAQLIYQGELPLQQWLEACTCGDPLVADEIYNQLINIRGIGPWTIHYALLRGFGWLDGSLHGDVAVRRNLQRLLVEMDKYHGDGKLSELDAKTWLAGFSPWRALVAAHLWAM